MNASHDDLELNRHLDGELDPARREAFDRKLAESDEMRARLAVYRDQDAALRELFAGELDEPVPEHLVARARLAREPRFGLRAALAAALCLGVGLGAVLGWISRGEFPASSHPSQAMQMLPHDAAMAHAVYSPEVRHPVEVGADQEAHLVTWLSKRLGGKIKVPQLRGAGYDLVGGRLLSTERGPAALFMFQNEKGQRLTLFLNHGTGAPGDTSFRYAREDNVGVFYWIDAGFGCALSGTMDREELLRLATLVYRQLDTP